MTHRFTHLLDLPARTAPVNRVAEVAFVACPAAAFAGNGSFVEEVYRLAREQTTAQLERRRVHRAAFSAN